MFDFSIVTTFIDNLLRQTLGLGDFLSILIECVLVGICILTAYALIAIVLIFMERKVCAYFQCRLGPMRVGPWGIFQVFADVLKMLIKEIFAVDRADKLLYYMAPFLVIIASVGTFSFLPWNKGAHILDFNPPRDRHVAITVLREALALGVNHIDTSDFYGPHVTNQIIREALYPYSDDLTIVTKIGARRGEDASWLPAFSPAELQKAVHDNLRNLGLDVLDVVNLRVMMGDGHGPAEGSIEASLTVLAEMQQQGLVKHIGLSNVTPTQVAEARKIAEIVCVQNEYNIAHRADDAMIDALAHDGIAYVPFFPLGGFTPLQSSTLSDVAASLGATPMQVALAWLLQRSPNILLIPGTSSVAHLRENMAAEKWHLSEEVLSTLDGISRE